MKRSVSATLLAIGLVWHAAGLVPLLAKPPEVKSCCKRKDDCCCKKSSEHPHQAAWKAAADCARQCRLSLVTPSAGSWLPAAPRDLPNGQPSAHGLEVHELAGVASPFYFAFLYQRPPPSV